MMRGRLACWVYLLAALGCFFVSPARADQYGSQGDALAACKASARVSYPDRPASTTDSYCGGAYPIYSSDATPGSPTWPTQDASAWANAAGRRAYGYPVGNRFLYFWWVYALPSDSACVSSDYPSSAIFTPGKVLSGYSICGNQTASDGSGVIVKCSRSFTPSGAPTMNPYSGQWETFGTLSASSSLCGSDAESNKWKKSDGTSPDSVPTTTPTPEANAPPTPNPPKLCGGGSCYDPKSDTACAVVGGGQVCVSGAAGRSPAGACVSSAGGSICSGSPTAPLPGAPPASPISDPATEIKATDKLTQADPVTGQNKTVTTNVYTPGNTPAESGAGEGDNKPPTQDPDKGSASGGQDCNSPPICSGDAPTCAVVDQVWLSRCGAPKDDKSDKNGNGQPDWTEVQPGDDAQYATDDTPAGSVFSTETTGVENIDQTSWAGNTCPTLPVVNVFGRPWSMDQGYFCSALETFRWPFIFVCGFIAIGIISVGGRV